MNVSEEEWLTTGQAAKIAARDIRTIRRWAEEGRLKARVSPGGHRQIALSSLLAVQQPARRTLANKGTRRRGRALLPDECLALWADATLDWPGWRPAKRLEIGELRELLDRADDVRRSLGEVIEVLEDAIGAAPSEAAGDRPVLEWLSSFPTSTNRESANRAP